jgi:hypothetical protein
MTPFPVNRHGPLTIGEPITLNWFGLRQDVI